MRNKTVIAILLLLTLSLTPAVSDAASVYVKKKPSTNQSQPVQPPVGSQTKPGQVPPMASLPGQMPDTPPCTEQDAKLVAQLDKKIKARSDAFEPEETADEAREWQENFKNKGTVKNLIDLYFRCAFVVMQQRQAAGIKPKPRLDQPTP